MLLLTPGWLPASPVESSVQAVVAGLAQPPPARVSFAEVRYLQVLDRPLQVTGEMAWLGAAHLQRKVLQPAAELVDIDGERVTMQRQGREPRHFSLRHAPELQLILQSFSALLSGDADHLEQFFELSLQQRPQQYWTLQLVPRDEDLRQRIPQIAMDGQGRQLRCMRIEEQHGDRSVELFGPLVARLPAAPQKIETLQRLCLGAD